jgi:hypothetical protein
MISVTKCDGRFRFAQFSGQIYRKLTAAMLTTDTLWAFTNYLLRPITFAGEGNLECEKQEETPVVATPMVPSSRLLWPGDRAKL